MLMQMIEGPANGEVLRRLEMSLFHGIMRARDEGRMTFSDARGALEALTKIRFEETHLRRGKRDVAPSDARRLKAILKRLARECRVKLGR